jgi:glycosyltransferase involved in cell wall biosynthesis
MVVSMLAPLGGIEAALTTLARELRRGGHDIRVFTLERPRPDEPNQNVDALARAGVPVSSPPAASLRAIRWAEGRRPQIAFGLSALTLVPLFPLILAGAGLRRLSLRSSLARTRCGLQTRFAKGLDFERLLYVALGRELRRMSPHVVHVHGWGCGEDPPGALAWLRTRPYALVYTEHNSPDPLVQPPFVRAPVENADVVIAVSKAGKSGLETVGRTSRPIRVIPYGVDPLPGAGRPPGSATDDFVVTCVARLAQQKGHRDLIAAMARLRQTVPNARLLLAGTGPLEHELLAESERLGLCEHVSFLGLIERADLADLFARTDVVVLPSYWEGLPVALVEALSAGKPIIASNAGGNPELVRNGENGLIVPIGDPDALAGALLLLAADPSERQRMGAAAAERYRRGDFDPASIAQQHIEVYRFARGVSKARAIDLAA